uniref:Reverse transcriptase domain-containing protein n=1 Tax=Tanacetum cinerariifolium TaxID=118510 RepID=A0A6L2LCL6_TANCI|nr:hypothetical protein [Tanacetum cinerariifolium]
MHFGKTGKVRRTYLSDRLQKGENNKGSLDEGIKNKEQWEGPEFQDTATSGEKKENHALTFYSMDEKSERYFSPCYVDGLHAYDREYKAIKENQDPGVFVLPIQLEAKLDLHALADTGSNINVMPYRIFAKFGRDNVKPVDDEISMLDHSTAKPIGILKDVLCQVGVTTILAKSLILDIPVDRIPTASYRVPTARRSFHYQEESSHCQKKREATAVKIALLLKSRRNCQSKLDDSYTNKYKTTQELWATILKTFSGNEATKKMKKNLLKHQFGNFKAEGSETLE